MSNRRIMGLIALAAVALVLVARQSPLASDRDSVDYDLFYRPTADSIRAGDGLTIDGEPQGRYPPGYPALLAAVSAIPGGDDAEITLINAVSLAAVGVLLFLLMLRMASRPVAVVAGLGVVTYPLLVYSAATPGTELPFVALVTAAALLAVDAADGRPWAAAAAGAAAGGATLIRPVGMGVVVVLALLVIVWRRDRRGLALAALLLGANLLVVAPWEMWLRQQDDDVVVPADIGVSTTLSGLTLSERDEAGGRTIVVPGGVVDLGHRAIAQQGAARTVGDIARFIGDEFDRSPSAVIMLFGVKAARSWYGTDSLRHEGWILLVQLPYLALAGVGLWAARRDRFVGLSIAMVGYFWLTAVVGVSIVRYMLPAMVFVVALAAVGIHRIARRAMSASPVTAEPGGSMST